MDETLFYIVIFIVYILFQVLGGKKKKKQKQKPSLPFPELPSSDAVREARQRTTGEPTLDDALREIRLALGMDTSPSRPQPTSPKPKSLQKAQTDTSKHPVRSHGPELAETAPKKSWGDEFHAIPMHYADSDFEEQQADGDRFGKPRPTPPAPRRTAKTTLPVKKRKGQASTTQQPPSSREDPGVLNLLQDPNTARKAFVLSEILGPPRARRQR